MASNVIFFILYCLSYPHNRDDI